MLLIRRLRRKIAVASELLGKASARSRGTPAAPVAAIARRLSETEGLRGKRVLVTGGSRGIGRAIALGLAAEGARVAILSRGDEAKAVAREAGPQALGLVADLADGAAVERAMAEIDRAFGGIDMLINNAGIPGPLNRPIWEMDNAALQQVLDVNIAGALRITLAALRRMVAQGSGRILNVSSGAVERTTPGMGAYAISKHGLEGMTAQIAAEAAGAGITVCSLRLGSLRTEMTERAFGTLKASLLPEPETVVPAFVTLATAPAALVQGRCFAAWRLLADAESELHSASPLSRIKSFSYPVYSHNGREVARSDPDFRIFDRVENRYGPAPEVGEALSRALAERPGQIYPDEGHSALRAALAGKMGLTPAHFAIGNGSWEVLDRLLELFTAPGDQVVTEKPGWFGFAMLADKRGLSQIKVPLAGKGATLDHDLDGIAAAVGPFTRLIYIISPSNPEGVALKRKAFEAFLAKVPDSIPILIDEAYAEYIDDPEAVTVRDLMDRTDRPLLGLRTFSKFHALASARVGYAYGDPGLIRLLDRGERIFSIAHLSEVAAVAALQATDHQARHYQSVVAERRRLTGALRAAGLEVVPSQAPYMMVELPDTLEKVIAAYAEHGIYMAEKAFYKQRYMLFPISTPDDNDRNLAIMSALTAPRRRISSTVLPEAGARP
ncbi:MAG: SDR family NAD(P)-dependent oxidoreductase [Paracoccaceae bacterium]